MKECEHEWSDYLTIFIGSPVKYCLGVQLKQSFHTYKQRKCELCKKKEVIIPEDAPSWLTENRALNSQSMGRK